jgi:hypothetical protein
MKRIWITALGKNQEEVQKLMGTLKNYGLTADGHFWVDDLVKMSWDSSLEALSEKDTAMWIILGQAEQYEIPTVCKGLSLLALAVQHRRGVGYPILLISAKGDINQARLPTPLKGADILNLDLANLGPKIVALANKPISRMRPDYRLSLHPIHGIGLWFEVGPAEGSLDWPGAMFGVHDAEIDFHGVGPADGIPERAVLEYAMKGMKIELGQDEFTAWAVQNVLSSGSSYYIRVQGTPDKIIFGAFATEDEPEVHILTLC